MKLLTFTLLLFVSSCFQQTMLSIGSMARNIIQSPFDAASDSVASRRYNELERDTKLSQEASEESSKIHEGEECKTGDFGDEIDKLVKISDKVKVCECIPWAMCSQNVCPCGKLCPNNFTIFQRPVGTTLKDISKEENALAFRNASQAGSIDDERGVCWGHANTTSRFNRLAFFDNNKKPPFDINSKDPEIQKQAIKYYKKIIDDIMDNKATDIPGFKNLKEFSSNTALQSYLADKVTLNWAHHAMGWQGTKVSLQSSPQTETRYKEVFTDIKKRLDMHMQPTIVFTKKGEAFDTHALLVSHYEEKKDGSLKYCLRDSNASAVSEGECTTYMEMKDGKLLYIYPTEGCLNGLIPDEGESCEWGEIGGIEVAHNNEPDAVAQVSSLVEKCLNHKKCPTE